jgi:hypothetical protein
VRRSAPIHGSIALASLAAGPIFLVSTGLAAVYLELPRPVTVDPALFAPFILFFIPAIIFGFILSIIPNLIGSRLLVFIGGAIPAARASPVWIGTGALFGTAIAAETGAFAQPAFAVGLILSSACSAAICRLSAFWD